MEFFYPVTFVKNKELKYNSHSASFYFSFLQLSISYDIKYFTQCAKNVHCTGIMILLLIKHIFFYNKDEDHFLWQELLFFYIKCIIRMRSYLKTVLFDWKLQKILINLPLSHINKIIYLLVKILIFLKFLFCIFSFITLIYRNISQRNK